MELIIGLAVGFGAAAMLALSIVVRRSKRGVQVQSHSSIVEMRSVGELIIFKVITKEIVTASEHILGDVGKNFLSWLVSGKKMAMIFEFGINFKYDLRSPDFVISEHGGGNVTLKMPRCEYETYIRDISFYDEQNSKLLPILLPEVLGRIFSSGFGEEDKNRLKEAARAQANRLAGAMAQRIEGEVRGSAEQTLTALAKGFGARQVELDFSSSRLVSASEADTKALEDIKVD
jgi:hypothetical protein